MHEIGYLHRDLKPESILIGQNKRSSIIHLADFSEVKRYICPITGQHFKKSMEAPKALLHEKKFSSLNAHLGKECSRVDDLIALGHILVYFYKKGNLPWDIPPLPKFNVDSKDPLVYDKTLAR